MSGVLNLFEAFASLKRLKRLKRLQVCKRFKRCKDELSFLSDPVLILVYFFCKLISGHRHLFTYLTKFRNSGFKVKQEC